MYIAADLLWQYACVSIRHEDSMCGPHGDTPLLWLGLTWGLHIELACAKPRRLWRLFGAEALLKSSRRRRSRGRRHGRVVHVPVPGHATASLTTPEPRARHLGGAGGRTTPLQAVEACRPGYKLGLPRLLLYEVSSLGMGTDRSHTAGWRYTVW